MLGLAWTAAKLSVCIASGMLDAPVLGLPLERCVAASCAGVATVLFARAGVLGMAGLEAGVAVGSEEKPAG